MTTLVLPQRGGRIDFSFFCHLMVRCANQRAIPNAVADAVADAVPDAVPAAQHIDSGSARTRPAGVSEYSTLGIRRSASLSQVSALLPWTSRKPPLRLQAKKNCNVDTETELKDAFRLLDENSRGYIECNELRLVCSKLGEEMTEGEVYDMVREAITNFDGKIYYDGFKKIMIAH